MKYTGNALNEISFPLGGIGTGSIGLAGNGRFVDWEIFNRPNKGSINGYSHIAVKAFRGGKPVCRILNGDITKDLSGSGIGGFGSGPACQTMCGFPHFRECTFHGEFPFAAIDFSDVDFPGSVRLTAFNPLIPLDSFNSSIPAAFFEITFRNDSMEDMEYEAAFTLANPFPVSRNTLHTSENCTTITLENAGVPGNHVEFGQLCLACQEPHQAQPYWYRGRWQDGIVTFWNEFTSEQGLSPRNYNENGRFDTCSMTKQVAVPANGENSVRFVVSWNNPNCYRYWDHSGTKDFSKEGIWKNYYATVFACAAESARYAMSNFDELYRKTLAYKDALFSSTVDPAILDAVSATISVLKSPTVSRLENGEFYGFEGSFKDGGACEGTCQHVYNYAYALCFLFPDLERSIRNLEFDYCTFEDGATKFRIRLPLETQKNTFRSCVDGQMGCVFKTYRE